MAPARSTWRRLARGSLTYGFGTVLQSLLAFLLIPIYTSHLATEEYGILGTANATIAVLGILFTVGLHGAVTRHYYQFRADAGELRAYLGTVVLFALVLAVAGGLALSLFARPLFERLMPEVAFSPFVLLAIWTAVLGVPVVLLMSLQRAREQASAYVLVQVGRFALSTVAIIVLVVIFELGVLGALTGLLLGTVLAFLASLKLLWRDVDASVTMRHLRLGLAYGVPMMPHLLFGWVMNASDRILLQNLASLQETGVYSFGYSLARLMGIAVVAVNSAWTPIFFDLADRSEKAPEVFTEIVTGYVAAATVLAIALMLFSRELVVVLAPPAYASAAAIIPLIVFSFLLQGLYFISVTPIFYKSETKWLPLISGAAAVVSLGVNLLLIPRIGMFGAALANVGAFGVLFIGSKILSDRIYPAHAPWSTFLLAIMVSVALVITLPWINGLPTWMGLSLKLGLIGGSVFLLSRVRLVDAGVWKSLLSRVGGARR